MWETTFAPATHAGLGKDLTTFHAYWEYAIFVNGLAQSGVGSWRKSGISGSDNAFAVWIVGIDFVFYTTKDCKFNTMRLRFGLVLTLCFT